MEFFLLLLFAAVTLISSSKSKSKEDSAQENPRRDDANTVSLVEYAESDDELPDEESSDYHNHWTFNFADPGERDPIWEEIRKKVFRRDGYKCIRCASTSNLTVDHITPRHVGGSDELDNLRTLCVHCHEEVHNRRIFNEEKFNKNRKRKYKPSEKVQLISSAISSNSFLPIEYTDEKGNFTRRNIQPITIFEEHGLLYVRSYCQLRHAERTFRLSRMILLAN